MNPEDVADCYLKQAMKMKEFIDKIQNVDYTNEEYKLILTVICQKYYELLINLAIFTPLLNTYKVKFYKIEALEYRYSHPPFDIDFFENHEL